MSADDYGLDAPPERPAPKRRTREQERAAARRQTPKALDQRLREALAAIGQWRLDKGDEELGGVLVADAPKMADVLARLSRQNPAAKKAVAILADVLEPVRAFGPTLRILWTRWLGRREEARLEREAEREAAGYEQVTSETVIAGGGDHEPPGTAEPWRLPAE